MAVHKRILVVEDDTLQAMDLEMAVEAAGMQAVGPAGTVQEALRLAEQSPPDFAVLDFNLGASTSTPIALALAARHVPFVYVTGKSSAQLREHGVPAAKVFQKPVPPQQVVDYVTSELGVA